MGIIRAELSPKVGTYVGPEDVLQDTYSEIIRRFDGFKGDDLDAFEQWAAAIARNKVREVHRRYLQAAKRGAGRRQQRLPGPFSQSGVSLLAMLDARVTTASRKAVRAEALEELAAALALLPEHYREVVNLRYIRGCSVEETARKVQRTKGAVLMICHRAMHQIADTIKQFPLLTSS